MRPSQVIITLEDLFSSKTGRLRRNGAELSDFDNSTALELYQMWSTLLLDLGYLPHEEDIKRDVGRFYSSLLAKDVLTTLNVSAELLQLVYRRIPCGIKGFKALCSQISHNLYDFIKEDVIKTYRGDAVACKKLVQFFAFPSRLSLRDIDLTEQCLADYVQVENDMDDWMPNSIVRSLNSIIKRWFKGIDLKNLAFRHGNGSTAGGIRSVEDKYKNLTNDALTTYCFGDNHLPSWDGTESISFSSVKAHMSRVSQTIFVPKSYKTFRTISMEPATLMFLQQGVWGAIDDHVNKINYLRNRIGFHDQTRNQVLARQGSLDRSMATIDLSAASDSVRWCLVKALFRGTPLLRYIVCTRSHSTVLPDGTFLQLKKFAPMGSALCFPIETIIFAAICELTTREHNRFGEYSVFGDDIIVPTECVEDVFYLLQLLGFTPNQSKSFYEGDCWFRESCGGEFVDGYNVTPLRISRKYSSGNDVEAAQGIMDMMNSCLDKSFMFLRRFLKSKLDLIGDKGFCPYFSETSLRSTSYSNYHAKRRWNNKHQRIECLVTVVKTNYSTRDESIAYYEWLRRHANDRQVRAQVTWWDDTLVIPKWDDEGSQSNTGRPIVVYQNRWLPKPFEKSDIDFTLYFTSEVAREFLLKSFD